MSTTTTAAALPVIIDPFSRLGDEIAGDTADQIALNVLAVVRTSRRHRALLLHPPPDLRAAFKGHKLTAQSRAALRQAEAEMANSAP